jgi:hypothetical protein
VHRPHVVLRHSRQVIRQQRPALPSTASCRSSGQPCQGGSDGDSSSDADSAAAVEPDGAGGGGGEENTSQEQGPLEPGASPTGTEAPPPGSLASPCPTHLPLGAQPRHGGPPRKLPLPLPLSQLPASLTALPPLNALIRQAWAQREHRRPAAAALHSQLQALLDKHQRCS